MSALKYQLEKVLSTLSQLDANKNKDPEIRRRLYLIKAVVSSKKDITKTCQARGVSTDVFYKWAGRLLKLQTIESLGSQSRAPKRKWNKTLRRVEKRVLALRKSFPFKGPERLSFDLKTKFNIVCAPSTVGAILKRAGLIAKTYKERLTKKHFRRYRRNLPGYMQMDIKYVPYLVEGQQFYQFSAIDHHSSWRHMQLYPTHSLDSTIKFLNELYDRAPFALMQIQTDNATEFTDKFSSKGGARPTGFHAFDQWCRDREIEHKLIPIGEKEINGKVENSHKFDDRELYSQYEFKTFYELRDRMSEYNLNWNEARPTKTLGWKTPWECVLESYPRAIAYINLMRDNFSQPTVKLEKHITQGGYIFKAAGEAAGPKKAKPPSTVDRYLKYLDWENTKKTRGFIPLPMMFQIFSPLKGSLSSLDAPSLSRRRWTSRSCSIRSHI
jgi:transposase-like protein